MGPSAHYPSLTVMIPTRRPTCVRLSTLQPGRLMSAWAIWWLTMTSMPTIMISLTLMEKSLDSIMATPALDLDHAFDAVDSAFDRTPPSIAPPFSLHLPPPLTSPPSSAGGGKPTWDPGVSTSRLGGEGDRNVCRTGWRRVFRDPNSPKKGVRGGPVPPHDEWISTCFGFHTWKSAQGQGQNHGWQESPAAPSGNYAGRHMSFNFERPTTTHQNTIRHINIYWTVYMFFKYLFMSFNFSSTYLYVSYLIYMSLNS